MTRTVHNAQTGETTTVPWTPEEQAAHQARYDADAFKRQRKQQDADAVVAAKADQTIQYLVTHTPQECFDWVQSNVTDLASAKVFLGRVAMALCVLARRELR